MNTGLVSGGSSRDVDRVLDRFRASGGRVTSARREIVSVVLGGSTHEHLTADEIGRRVELRYPEMALSTVYRSLDALADLGVLEHVHMGHGPAVYHLTDEQHLHLVCNECQAVIQVDQSAMDSLRTDLEQLTGFVIAPRHFAINGLCVNCAEPER